MPILSQRRRPVAWLALALGFWLSLLPLLPARAQGGAARPPSVSAAQPGAIPLQQQPFYAELEATRAAWQQHQLGQVVADNPDVVERTDTTFAFNVTRCRYAEMYRALGVPELGEILSCNRDGSMIEGFNGSIRFGRTQTIMQGASHCDFRYTLDEA